MLNPSEVSKKLGDKRLVLVIAVFILAISFFIANFIIAFLREVGNFLIVFMDNPDVVDFNFNWNWFITIHTDMAMGYVIFYLLIFVLIFKISYNMKMNFDDLDSGQHGSRRFEDVKELKKQYKVIPSKTEEYEGSGGVIIGGVNEKGRSYRLMIDESPVHTMCIGITRSGKGETFVVPMIDVLSRAKDKPSLVVNDPKGELAGASYQTLVDRGYEVHVFNLIQQHMGMGFNPLQMVINAWKLGDKSLAQQYATSIGHSLYHDPNAKDPFWSESAKSLVTGIVLAITEDSLERGQEEKINMYSVANFLSDLGSDEDDQGNNALDDFFQARPDQNPAKLMYATSNFAGGNTRSSIFAIAMQKLQIFTTEPNARLTGYNSMDLTDVGFGDKPVAVFMVTPDFDSSNHVLASIFVSQLYRVNAEKATMESGKMDRHVHFMLDEFGNMPTVEGMASMVTVGAGRGFRFHLVVQAYSQIKSQYGDEAETIIGNCSNQIYILTQDKDTAEQYSGLLGTKTITDVSRTGQLLSTDKSHSESVKERALLLPDELMELKEGESVVIRVNKRQDNKRNKIAPRPIFNSLKSSTYHKFRYQYLAEDFDTDISVLTLPLTSNKYHDIKLNEIVFTSSFKDEDQYVPLSKITENKEIMKIKSRFASLNKERSYDDIEDWSLLHLFSHLVYELRAENDYYKMLVIVFNKIVSEDYLDYWWKVQKMVNEEKGAILETPPNPSRAKQKARK